VSSKKTFSRKGEEKCLRLLLLLLRLHQRNTRQVTEKTEPEASCISTILNGDDLMHRFRAPPLSGESRSILNSSRTDTHELCKEKMKISS
jgi:hypothetical protein